MSEADEEAIRRAYAAFSRRDFEAAFELLDPAIEWKPPDRSLYAGTYRGHEAVRELLQSQLEVFGDFRWDLERLFHAGDQTVVFVTVSARGKSSGATVDIRVAHLLRLRDGKIIRFEVFPKREDALSAVGIEE